jgi:hypothetical protein
MSTNAITTVRPAFGGDATKNGAIRSVAVVGCGLMGC